MTDEELKNVAELIVEDTLQAKKGDKILITTDDGIKDANGLVELRQAIIDVMNEKDLDPCVLSYQPRTKKGAEIPELAEAACLAADVLVCINTNSFLHASAFPRIYQGGKTNRRLLLLPTVPNVGKTDYLDRSLPESKEELYSIDEMTEKYGRILKDGNEHKVHLTAANGTDLTLSLGQLNGSVHCGICHPGTIEIIPSGSLALGVDEGSAEGTLVVDCCTALEKRLLNGKICFEIHDGYAQSVTGGEEADKFLERADAIPNPDKEKFNIAEFGLGFNPKAKINGDSSEGEHVIGAAHIGIGSNVVFGGHIFIPAWHIDCIIPNATVEADGKLIVKDGEYLV